MVLSKRLKDYPNYALYSDGRLWSDNVKRFLIPFGIGRVLKTGSRDYLAYKLCSNGTEWTVQAHRLVAEAFISNPENLPEVNHIDGDKKNNCVSNLEWVSRQANIQHAFDTGLNNGEMWQGEKHSRSTYTNEDVEKICKLFSEGVLPKDLAKSTTKEYQKLFRIWNRDNWTSISDKYVW